MTAANKIPEILPIWQPVGYSTHIIASNVAKKYGVKTSHTGTIDPMAEGVIIILLGKHRHKKYDYAEWLKTYSFDVALGVSTDTLDGLGLITEHVDEVTLNEQDLKKAVACFKGSYKQKVPVYSAIKVKGKPLHWHARNQSLAKIEIPQRTGTIHEFTLTGLSEVPLEELVASLSERINKVTGDLRQEEALKSWQQYLRRHPSLYVHVASLKAKLSKGLYVRGLARDLLTNLGMPGFVYHLIRDSNGAFNKSNSSNIDQLFYSDKYIEYNFTSKVPPTTK